ncbi:hypothetical protein K1Y72_35520 [Actinomadura sp. PM05-2]|uniref:Uncharacterized protein n=1 Tax=Actinomadura parmotrematis TaxID=2864039 RepID=A0ABS7G4U4_9ACTN|nr:hypothetical protein [Actinomadura parmotrematis]
MVTANRAGARPDCNARVSTNAVSNVPSTCPTSPTTTIRGVPYRRSAHATTVTNTTM